MQKNRFGLNGDIENLGGLCMWQSECCTRHCHICDVTLMTQLENPAEREWTDAFQEE